MKTIEIGGKDRPVHYGINALADFNDGTNTNLDWLFKLMARPLNMNVNQIRWLVFVGLKQGALENGEIVDFDVNIVGNWLDKDFSKLKLFMEALRDSMPLGGDDTKKK